MANGTLVQCVGTPSGHSNALGSTWHVYLPNPTLAGNLIVVFAGWAIESPNATLGSVTDDASSTYSTGVATVQDGPNTYQAAAVYLANNPGGIRRIDIPFATATAHFTQFWVGEFRNIVTSSPLDASHGGIGSGTAWAGGSFNTTSDGDFVIQWVRNTLTSSLAPASAAHDGSLPGATILSFDNVETGAAVQIGNQTTHGATNPAITSDQNVPFISLCMAFKTASAGTAPGTPNTPGVPPRIVRVQGYNVTPAGNSQVVVFPSANSLIVCQWVAGAATNPILTAVKDTQSNKWRGVPGPPGATTAAGFPNQFYALHATPAENLGITFQINASGPHGTALLYDVEGADGDIDVLLDQTIGNTTGTTTLTTVTTQTIRENSLVFACVGVEGGTCKECVGTAFYNDNAWWAEEDATVNEFYENNGWGHKTTTTRGPLTWAWTVTSDTFHWAVSSLAFCQRNLQSGYTKFPKQPIAKRAQGLP